MPEKNEKKAKATAQRASMTLDVNKKKNSRIVRRGKEEERRRLIYSLQCLHL